MVVDAVGVVDVVVVEPVVDAAEPVVASPDVADVDVESVAEDVVESVEEPPPPPHPTTAIAVKTADSVKRVPLSTLEKAMCNSYILKKTFPIKTAQGGMRSDIQPGFLKPPPQIKGCGILEGSRKEFGDA